MARLSASDDRPLCVLSIGEKRSTVESALMGRRDRRNIYTLSIGFGIWSVSRNDRWWIRPSLHPYHAGITTAHQAMCRRPIRQLGQHAKGRPDHTIQPLLLTFVGLINYSDACRESCRQTQTPSIQTDARASDGFAEDALHLRQRLSSLSAAHRHSLVY